MRLGSFTGIVFVNTGKHFVDLLNRVADTRRDLAVYTFVYPCFCTHVSVPMFVLYSVLSIKCERDVYLCIVYLYI